MKKTNEKYFFNYFGKITKLDSQYLNLPTEISFNTCLDECISYCRKSKEVERIRDTRFFTDFYNFLLEDNIMQRINSSEYLNLLDKLSKASNKSISINELEVYFKKIRFIFGKRHFNLLVEQLKENIQSNEKRFLEIEKLTMQFVNELIFNKLTYKFLTNIYYHDYYKGKKFNNSIDFIDYLAYEDKENIEMYLPLKNYTERDIDFLNSQNQQVEKRKNENGEEIYYCKIYSNDIDYVNVCNENMIRIESFFNLFKFYRSSQIGFDYTKNVYIERKNVIQDYFDTKFSSLISFSYFVGKQKIVDNVVINIDKLKENNNSLFYSINNVLAYAEKDNDLLTVSSYVDNWIALETLIKFSNYKNGFEGVLYYLPRSLGIQYYRKVLNETLKRGREIYSLDNFFDLVFEDKKISGNYFNSDREFVNQQVIFIKNIKEFKNEIYKIQDYLERDLYRIYNLRNEYVHSSNINAHFGVKQYKLKRLFSDFFDLFMKTLNSHIKENHLTVDGGDVFSDISKKCDNRELTLKLLTNQLKINGAIFSNEKHYKELEYKQIIANIIFDRLLLLNQSSYFDDDDS